MKSSTRKYSVRILTTILFILLISSGLTYGAYAPKYGADAVKLYQMDILSVSEVGLELDRVPTRLEALITVLKLTGQSDEAQGYLYDEAVHQDVPDWAKAFTNYAYYEDLVVGGESIKFNPSEPITSSEYVALILEAMGYEYELNLNDSEAVMDYAEALGMMSFEEQVMLENNPFLRDQMSMLSVRALATPVNDQNITLIESLLVNDDIDASLANKLGIYSGTEMDVLIKIFVEFPNDAYDEIEANEMIENVRNIPENYLERLIDDGTRLRLINNPLTEEPEYAYLKGVVPRGWEETGLTWDDVPGAGGQLIIARIGHSDPGPTHGSYNLELHEVGHQIDSVVFSAFGAGSDTEIFSNLTDMESGLFEGAYYQYDEEFFAEAFTMYYLNEETNAMLLKRAPSVHAYFRSMEEHYGYDK